MHWIETHKAISAGIAIVIVVAIALIIAHFYGGAPTAVPAPAPAG